MTNDIVTIQQLLNRTIDVTGVGKEISEVSNAWKRILLRIKPYNEEISDNDYERLPLGERLASTTRIVDLKKGVLLVEVDHSGWIQYLQIYKKFIINGLNREFPELKINTLSFRVAGSTVGLSDLYNELAKKEQKKILDKSLRADEQIKKVLPDQRKEKISSEKVLPSEILAQFDDIIKNIEASDVD